MRRNFWVGLFLILVVIGLGGYVSWPTTTTIGKRDVKLRQGLDLQGGVWLRYKIDLSKTASEDQSEAIESTRGVIEKRVNSTGVTEPLIQPGKIGSTHTMIVELPGIKDVREAIDLIGKTAQLEFREPDSSSKTEKWIPTGLTGKQLSKATVSYDQDRKSVV